MTTIKTFPQVIFVTVEEDQGSDYMLASLTKQEALNEPSRVVGIYQFVRAEQVRQGDPVATRRKTRKTA